MTFIKDVQKWRLFIAFLPLITFSSMAGEYRLNFNQASTAYQDKGNSLQLKLPPGGVTWQMLEDKTGVLAFDGKSMAALQISDKLQNSSFTVEINCLPDSPDSNAKQAIIYSINPNNGAHWGIIMQSKWRLGVQSGENKKEKNFNVLSPAGSRNKWRRLAFVKDNSENMFRFYADDELVKEQSFSGADSLVCLGKKLTVGGALSGSLQSFSGLIKEVIIYDEARRYPATFSAAYQAKEAISQVPDSLLSSSWNELEKYQLNIVPAPKEIKVKEKLKIDSAWHLVVLAPEALAGVEEINRRFVECGAKALVTDSRLSGNKIIIGSLKEVQKILKNNINTKLQAQGYIIDSIRENNEYTIFIAGADTDGIRYGCITLSMLIQPGAVLYNAQIIDYPDFLERMSFCSQTKNNGSAKKNIDEAFRSKINLIWGKGFGQSTASLIEKANSTKELSDYAQARGIRIVLGSYVNVGEAPMSKDLKNFSPMFFPYKTNEGLIGHRNLAFTWSRDDLLDSKGAEWARFVENSKINSFYMHCMDTGGRENPENWRNRTPEDRRRWGDDRASADANLVNRLYGPMKKVNPDIGFYYVAYPYGGSYLQYPDVKEWLTKLSQLLPPDIYFCLRESSRENTEKWKNSTRQGIYLYHDPYPSELRLNYTAAGRYAATFRFTDRKVIYWFLQTQDFQDISIWTAAEYAWNTKAPGWNWFPSDDRQTPVAESVPAEIKTQLLPSLNYS